ncbi:MAG: hypothetical protein Q4F31_00895 [Eubacteriales bacterium]|nr:hypothetical protein [Eubacteriales bacterium]
MKKRFVLFLIVAILFCNVFACADGIDLKSLSNKDLLSLYESIRNEMSSRGIISARALPEGKYIVGEDILPGTYRITCTGTEGEDLSNTYSALGNAYGALLGDEWGSLMGSLGGAMSTISEASVKILGDYGTVIKSISMKTGDVSSITLNEGTALEITDGSITIEWE